MISYISPIKEANSQVIVSYPRIALKRPFGPDAVTGGGGDLGLVPPVQKQAKKTHGVVACPLCLCGQGGHLAHVVTTGGKQ